MSRDNGAFDMPGEMRAFAERSMEQARTAFDSFVNAAQQAANVAQTQAMNAHSGAREVGTLAMQFTERNIASSFEFAQKLLRAKDAAEVAAMHSDYVTGQVAALTEQARELSRHAGKIGGAATSH
jgi:phasin